MFKSMFGNFTTLCMKGLMTFSFHEIRREAYHICFIERFLSTEMSVKHFTGFDDIIATTKMEIFVFISKTCSKSTMDS